MTKLWKNRDRSVMTLPSNLELAKQGDPKAIASAISYLLQDKGITAQADIKDGCLRVLLESTEVPDRELIVKFIPKLIMQLEIDFIRSIRIYAKLLGKSSAEWRDFIDLNELKLAAPNLIITNTNFTFNEIDLELDRLRGEMGLTVMKKGKANPLKSNSPSQNDDRKPQKLVKNLLILLLLPAMVGSIYLIYKLTAIKKQIPIPVASESNLPLPSISARVIPTPVASESPAISTQSDPFPAAVNNAMTAAKLAQSAKSKADWNVVASQWKEAIALMRSVPASHLNYAVSQQKIVEYQKNLDDAELAANRAE